MLYKFEKITDNTVMYNKFYKLTFFFLKYVPQNIKWDDFMQTKYSTYYTCIIIQKIH